MPSITLKFTMNDDEIENYLSIYEKEFRLSHDNPMYKANRDRPAPHIRVCVIYDGNLCIGGACLSVRTPENPKPLPIEEVGLNLGEYFPELANNSSRYGQVRQICLDKNYRNKKILKRLMEFLHEEVKNQKLKKVFGTSMLTYAKAYSINLISMGLNAVEVYNEIELPKYDMCENIKFVLIGGNVEA